MKRFFYNSINCLSTGNTVKLKIQLAAICIFMIRGVMIILEHHQIDPNLNVVIKANISYYLRFNNLLILSFNLISIFFVITISSLINANRNGTFLKFITDFVVLVTDCYLIQPDETKQSQKKVNSFRRQVLQHSLLIRLSNRILNIENIFTNKMVNFALSSHINTKTFPFVDPVSKFSAMFLLNCIETFHRFFNYFYGNFAFFVSYVEMQINYKLKTFR